MAAEGRNNRNTKSVDTDATNCERRNGTDTATRDCNCKALGKSFG
jgi:hypothetical protein